MEYIPFSTNTCLILLISVFFVENQHFLPKIVLLLKAIVWELCKRIFINIKVDQSDLEHYTNRLKHGEEFISMNLLEYFSKYQGKTSKMSQRKKSVVDLPTIFFKSKFRNVSSAFCIVKFSLLSINHVHFHKIYFYHKNKQNSLFQFNTYIKRIIHHNNTLFCFLGLNW